MKIYGIAVYSDLRAERGRFQKLQSSPAGSGGLFSSNVLENLEKRSLPRLPEPGAMEAETPYYFVSEGEHHYIMLSKSNYVLAIVSRQSLVADTSKEQCEQDLKALFRLFHNIEHAYIRPLSVNTTLDKIVANPLGYIGKDLLISKVSDQIQEVKMIAMDNMEKLLERGEKIEALFPKTVQLEESSLEFKKRAEDLNRRCCWF